MIELFPEGFEEIEDDEDVELAAYTDASGEERLWHRVRRRREQPTSRPDGRTGWRALPPARDRRPALGRPAVGGAARRPDRRSSSTPAARSAPEHTRRRASASSCSPGCRAVRCSTWAAAPGCSRSRPPSSASHRSPPSTTTRSPSTRLGERRGERRAVDVQLVDAVSDPLPAAQTAVANISLDVSAEVASRLDCERLVSSGYLVSNRLELADSEPSSGSRTRAGRPTCGRS